MEKITMYKTEDGKYFEAIEEAESWQESLKWRNQIEHFLLSGLCAYRGGAHGGMTKKIIISWETYKTKYQS
jgi:hypothetical protein